jgi:hypothetical protein
LPTTGPDIPAPERYQQRVLRRSRKYSLLPQALVAGLLVLLVWEMLRVNVNSDLRAEFPWRVTLLGVDTTASIVAAFIGVIIARGQFARAIQPTLGSLP